MLEKMRTIAAHYLNTPSEKKLEAARPPESTPDLVFLEQQPMHWVFDYRNWVTSPPAAITDAFTDQRFYMFQQRHYEGWPQVVFKDRIHNTNIHCPRAKLRGKLHLLPSTEIILLDKKYGNRLHYSRRQVRVLVPNQLSHVLPEYINAWVYYDREEFWEPQFDFDWDLWRGKNSFNFVGAHTILDSRGYVSHFFQPRPGRAIKPRLELAFRDGDRYRDYMEREHENFIAELKDRPQPHPADEMRRFIYISTEEKKEETCPTPKSFGRSSVLNALSKGGTTLKTT